MLKRSLVTLLSIAVAQVAMATDAASKFFPPKIPMGEKSLVLNGTGYHHFLFFKIYEAGLYLPKKATKTAEIHRLGAPKRARILMLDAVSAKNFVLVLRDGLVANTPKNKIDRHYEEIVHFFEMMEGLGHLVEGDLVDLDFSDGQTSIRLNHRPIVTNLGGREFYEIILNIWLGEKPLDEGLKRDLLAS